MNSKLFPFLTACYSRVLFPFPLSFVSFAAASCVSPCHISMRSAVPFIKRNMLIRRNRNSRDNWQFPSWKHVFLFHLLFNFHFHSLAVVPQFRKNQLKFSSTLLENYVHKTVPTGTLSSHSAAPYGPCKTFHCLLPSSPPLPALVLLAQSISNTSFVRQVEGFDNKKKWRFPFASLAWIFYFRLLLLSSFRPSLTSIFSPLLPSDYRHERDLFVIALIP